MGAGRSLEAAYRLSGAIPAGTWTFVLDGICLQSVDVRFELIHRTAGGEDRELTAFGRHFDPLDSGEYRAQPFEQEEQLEELDPADGDQLVLRYTGDGSALMMAWIPNGDGELTGGRIPYLDLP